MVSNFEELQVKDNEPQVAQVGGFFNCDLCIPDKDT